MRSYETRHRPRPARFFTPYLKTSDVCKSVRDGVEVGTERGFLKYIYITIDTYKGGFSKAGAKVILDPAVLPDRVKAVFGEPYWTDSADDEIILFYEFGGGRIELPFEFSEKRSLGIITLLLNGILSDAEQRRAYGVTKAWPPSTS